MSIARQRAKPEAASSTAPATHAPLKTAAKQKKTSAETVTVACKMPNGMLLQVCKLMDIPSPSPADPHRMVKEWRPVGDKITVNGPSLAPDQRPEGFRVVAGFALTDGVPKDFWDEWLRQHKDDASVKNGLIFANPSSAYVSDQAKDSRSLRSGLEPLQPDKDPRIPVDKKNRLKVVTGNRDDDK